MPALIWTVLTALGCSHVDEGEAEVEPHYDPVPVHVVTVESATVKPTLQLIGRIVAIPEQTVVLGAQVDGTIDKVLVVEGQTVKIGDSLITLNSRLVKVDEARAQATVDEQQAVVNRLQRGPLPQEIDVAIQAVAKSKADVDALKAKLGALEPLRKQDEISKVQFDVARAGLQAAQADHAAVEARLSLLKAGTREEDIAEGKAKLANAKADLAAAELAVQFCNLTSPIDGSITQVNSRQGMSVDRNTVVATVVNESTLFVQFRVPKVSLFKVVPGALVHVQLAALPERTVEGVVTRLASQADTATGDVDAFATITNVDGLFRPGLGCRVTVDLPELSNVLVIPAIALADRDGTPVVTVVKDNKAYEVEIKIGVRFRNQVQVLNGLLQGDVIVTENGYGLPDECPVKIIRKLRIDSEKHADSPSNSHRKSSPE